MPNLLGWAVLLALLLTPAAANDWRSAGEPPDPSLPRIQESLP